MLYDFISDLKTPSIEPTAKKSGDSGKPEVEIEAEAKVVTEAEAEEEVKSVKERIAGSK